MALFTLIDDSEIRLENNEKIIPKKDLGRVLDSAAVVQATQDDAVEYKKQVTEEIEKLKQQAQEEGYQQGLKEWAQELSGIEEEISKSREEFEKIILRTALMAAKKFVGKELELHPETMIDIVSNSLKAVTQHKRIFIYCNKKDYELLDKARPQFKEMFDELELLSVNAKDNVEEGGYIIETERGIINHGNVQKVWQTLENAFEKLLEKEMKNKASVQEPETKEEKDPS